MENLNQINTILKQLKDEHSTLGITFAVKRNEINGLKEGMKKYANNPQMIEQIEELVITKCKEIEDLQHQLKSIERRIEKVKLQLDYIFSESNTKENEVPVSVRKNVIVTESKASEKMINQAIKEKDILREAYKKSVVVVEKKIEQKADHAEKSEIKAEIKPQKAASKKTLNEVAKSEADAQAKYLNSQRKNTSHYGQA